MRPRTAAVPGVVFDQGVAPPAVDVQRSRVRGSRTSTAATALGVAAVCIATAWVTRSPIFAMRHLRVTGGSHVSTGEVARLGGLGASTNLLWLSPSAVQDRLRRDPWIASAGIHRSLPSTLQVTIVERRPVAIAMPGAWLVASDGDVLGPAPARTPLPVIRPGVALRPGARIASSRLSLTVARTLPRSLRQWTDGIEIHRRGQVVLQLSWGGLALMGPVGGIWQKEAAVAGVLGWARGHGVRVEEIDARVWSTPTLTVASS